ncbi:shikimate dehydrogenase family protein [Longitalea luteola]|uniref:shikimate dehydrogenase family protein n=1 Tax=Longitalea luteola TaxID=2812563 RepID=UPI001A9728BC|nr:shikimate dehydrogenase [Longitalea luteola]
MKKYGLIGFPLSHSFSQKYFTEKFQREKIDGCRYENFPLASIDEFPALIQQQSDLHGLNVTIPYKEKVIPFLTARSEVVKTIGACNCIKIENGQLTGHNTDVVGFEMSLRPLLQPFHKKALVLGTGGAAKAVQYVLNKLDIAFLEVSRNPVTSRQIAYHQIDATVIKEHQVIINTSPLGMYPNINECPPLPYEALTETHYLFDLIYNPERTLFLQRGEERGAAIKNGHDMLIIQAEESWRIWTM